MISKEIKKQDFNLDATISALEAKRGQINHAIDNAIASLKMVAAFDSSSLSKELPKGSTMPLSRDRIEQLDTDTFFNMTFIEATVKYLKMIGSKQSSEQIIKALTSGGVEIGEESAKTLLRKRAKQKRDIVKVGRGLWGLKEWYNS